MGGRRGSRSYLCIERGMGRLAETGVGGSGWGNIIRAQGSERSFSHCLISR